MTENTHPGVIHNDASYELSDFKARTRISARELDKAEQAGLKIVALGKRRYVRGSRWNQFLSELEDA